MTSTEQPQNPQDAIHTPVIFPATFAQQRLWFLDQLQPGGVTYLINWTLRLKGDLDVPALGRALDEIVNRHHILRTTFAVVDGEVCQLVHESTGIPLPVVNLAAHEDPESEVLRLSVLEAATPIDLANGPVIRAQLLRLSAREHVLLLTLHHIFFDGSSRAVFIRDFSALYEAFRNNQPSPLPEPRLQYGNYAAWQHKSIKGKRYRKLLDYWKKQLADAPTVLELPTDRPRPAVETSRGATKAFEWPAELSTALIALSRKHNASLFMTLLTAFECLLARYSGQDDIVVGVPVASRTREELEGMIGLFANELALRLQIPEDATFEQLLTKMRETALDAFDHEEMPLDRLILEINPERSASRNPLFQVLFSMRNYHIEKLQLAGLEEAEFTAGKARTAKFDLSLYVTENNGLLSGWFEYSTDLFDEPTIERMVGHYRVLTQALVTRPSAPVAELPLLTEAEKRHILLDFNDTAVPYPRDRSLHEFIEDQVARTPDAPALIFESVQLTYAELNARANQLAHRLRAMGVTPGDMVAVCALRSAELVIALLGTMKAGGAYVPLDPDYPRERLAVMLEDSEPRVVLALERLLDVLPPHSAPVFCLDRDWPQLASESEANPPVVTSGSDYAYMIYTSGSTGKPKGVPNFHSAIVNRLLWMQAAYPLDATDKVLQKTPYSFDVSVWEFFWPFMTGACMIVARPEAHKDPSYLADLISDHGVTTLHFVPSMLRVFLDAQNVERCTSLRRVICSGEALPHDLQERFFRHLRAELHNLYGPTEAAVDVTYFHCVPGSPRTTVPIGKPIWNTQIYILDKRRNPVPIGVSGELHIGGAGLAAGYLKRPELTAEKFIADPFSSSPEARLYKTGDLARFLPDGNIEYLGRLDFQVKLRGLRIELGEIEAALDSHPAVKQSVVLAREDEPGDKRLVAYFVTDPEYRGEDQEESREDLSTEQVSQWALAFDEAYRSGGDASDATFNIAGWNSSYTGGPIPPEEMRVWVETTVDRILALRPERVWEIGCGTGLLLFRIAPHCKVFRGTDISQTALDFLRTQLDRRKLSNVTLARRSAHEFDAVAEPFDVVVINSVIQYFPDLDYLATVIEGAAAAVRPGGAVFIGDVRSLPLLRMFHASVQLHKAGDTVGRAELLSRVERDARQEGELVVDPDFFATLSRRIAGLGRVEIQLKRGLMHNELTRFRYDVLLHIGEPAATVATPFQDWTRGGFTPARLRQTLSESPDPILAFTHVPNARIFSDAEALRLLESDNGPATAAEIREVLTHLPGESLEPDALWSIGRESGVDVEIRTSLNAVDGCCDVVLRRPGVHNIVRFPGETGLERSWDSLATNPLRQKVAASLIPQVRAFIGVKLPDYMIPSAFVLLDAMPLSANGKVNRRALPRPEYARDENVSYVAPRTLIEERLAEIWNDVLHVRVGANDDFFALGGHSLLATQVVSRIRNIFHVEIPLRVLFESPTLAALAGRIELLQQEEGRIEPVALTRVTRGDRLPLSFAQQRLWFLDQLEPLNPLYNITSALRFRGELNVPALASALNEIVRRQESLRTRFELSSGEPAQIVEDHCEVELPLAHARSEEEAADLIRAEARKPFVLTAAPLLRAILIRLAPDEHVLATVAHHIASDGWSFGVFAAELSALYEAFSENRPPALPELPVQYVDFAAWQRGHLTPERLNRHIEFWKEQLAGAPPVLELPADRPRPAIETFRGARQTVQLSPKLLDRLQKLSRAEGVTLFMTLLSAFGALLSRYSGQEDIVIGSPIAGRPDPQLEKLIGLFLNTIVLRTRFEGEPTFRDLLARVRQTAMAAYAHQDLPFEKLIEAIAPARDLSRNPLFQAMLILQNMPAIERRFGGARATTFAVNNPTSKFDLTLLVSESAEGLRTTLEYNTDLFDAATIARMLRHFENLLEAAAAHPERRLSELPLLGEEESAQVLFGFNTTTQDYPRNHCLHQLLTAQAYATPNAIAVVSGNRSLTYGELNERANRLAHGLIARGAAPEVLIGIRMSRGVDMLAGLLGILKSGAAYVPLDPSFPQDRIAYILEDSAASIVLTDDMFTEDGWREFSGYPATDPATPVTPDNLAYVLHTSGSTGRPKGVQITHRNLVNFLVSMRREPGFSPDDTLLAVTTISFDIAGLELYLPLLAGGKLVIASREESGDGAQLLRMIGDSAVTILQATPATWRMLIQSGWKGSPQLKALCGGEALPSELAEQLLPRSAELWNMYGPTETTVWSSVYRLQSVPQAAAPLGKPIANTTMYVLDARLEPLPIGVAGELYIGGDGVARGYLNRPDLTEERFLPDPFLPGARIYKTGDIAKLLPTGDFQYLGRADFQVKVRGFRIELGEVETVLAQHPAVRECVVAALDERLIGYVIPSAGAGASAAELRAWVKERLPEYMVPAVFIALEAFPLTPNGKVDRKALPAPEAQAPVDAGFIAPATPTEEIVAQVWAHVLKLGRVGAHDNFFELGGHSLLATQAVSRIREAFGIELPMRALFEAPTVAGLAERIEALDRRVDTMPLCRVEGQGPWPLSFAQQRLWFLDQLEPLDASYNVPYIRRLGGPVDVSRIQFALGEITRRHETLRTRFTTVNGEPAQMVDPWSLPPLTIVNADNEAAAREAAIHQARTPFHLETGPLLRALLIRIDANDHVLVINTHHTVSDGWSLGVIARELSAFYNNPEVPLAPLPVRYTDYAIWQRHFLSGERLENELAYWTHQLHSAPRVLELPLDRPRPVVLDSRGGKQTAKLPLQVLDALQVLSREQGVTLFMTLLGAFGVFLSRYSGQEEVVIGSPVAGRNRSGVESLIGVFVNTLALRVSLANDPAFPALLAQVRETAMGAYAHQDLPFEKLVEALEPGRDLSRHPLFQAMLVLENIPARDPQFEGVTVSRFPASNLTSKFDLMLLAAEHTDGLSFAFEYNGGLFEPSTVERMLANFANLLTGIAAQPSHRASELPVMTSAECRQVLLGFNDTARDLPLDRSLHQFIEDQVERTPDLPALVFEPERLTYRELNTRANQLAHRLRVLGVHPGSLVAVCAERSIEMVVALLGVLKASGAYVPLDPDYPHNRLASMLEDADPVVVLTLDRLRHVLPPHGKPTFCLDSDWPSLANESVHNPPLLTTGHDRAYVIYTSGSTGKPKGVPNRHSGIVNRLLWMQAEYGLNPSDKVLQKTPYSFDVSVWEFFWPLMTGACLVVARPEGHKDPVYLVDLIERESVTTLHFVPSMLRIFLEAEHLDRCGCLRRVICSGEALPVDLQERFFERLPVKPHNVELHNLYGPTEAAVDVTSYRCVPRSGRSSVPIGKPVWNTQIYILDARLQPVPLGASGELHIGGVQLAEGYLRRPELTAEKFIPDPFCDTPGARLYKSGDLARHLPDGNVEYLGRIDFQVKLRGFRIELGEIETALMQNSAVRECVVVVREDTTGEGRLVAYLVPRESALLTDADLRAGLLRSVPEYMVPSAFVILDKLPLSPNGKVSRQALPAPALTSAAGFIAPRNPIEEGIAAVWADVLRTDGIGADSNFFHSGGHSLSATQVLSRIRQTFQVSLPLRAIFEAPVLADLAVVVSSLLRAGEEAPPAIPPVSRSGPLPLSFAQQRLWILDRIDPDNPLYNVPVATRMTGALNPLALEAALSGVVSRHEVLRTTYVELEDRPVQVIASDFHFALPVLDLTHLDAADRETEARRLCDEEAARPFRLASDLMLRGVLIRLAAEDHVLFLNMHHIATDGWSLGILRKELAAIYRAGIEGSPAPLAPLTVQYADYSVWQRNRLQGETLGGQLEYWRAKLRGAPPVLALPTDRPRPAVQTFGGATYTLQVDRELAEIVAASRRAEGTTLFMTLLAAFKTLIFCVTGQTDIVLGTDLAGRDNVQTEALIGFFVNLLALRTDLTGDPAFRELLGRVRETGLGAYAHQEVPFEKLVEELQPERSMSHNPLVQVLFVQNTPRTPCSMPGIEWGPFHLHTRSKFDMAVFAGSSGDEISLTWVCNPDLFDQRTIENLATRFTLILRKACQNPEIRLSELKAAIDNTERASFENASLRKLKGSRRKAAEI